MIALTALIIYLAAMAVAIATAKAGRKTLPQPAAPHVIQKRGVGFTVPIWFRRQAFCIESHENGGYGWHAHTGNGYETGLQFLPNTWARAGGSFHAPEGHFYGYSVAEIIYRAWRIYRQDGGSWREWSTARMCGLA